MSSNPPSYTSASVSRSRTSRDDMRALADEMLRASLTRSSASASVASTSTSTATAGPPSYRRSATPAFPAAVGPPNPADLLRSARGIPGPSSRPPAAGSASITRDSLYRDASSVRSSASRVSAADAKARVRELQLEIERAKASAPGKKTEGLFRAACSTDLLFLIDTTYSMASYINAAKEQVKSIVKDIKEAFLNESEVRIAVVSYKDHDDKPNIQFLDFTTSADEVRRFLDTLKAAGGADIPEDVLGGLQQALNASWKQQTRCIIHIADAPPHGHPLHDLAESRDNYYNPGSEPHRLTYEPLLSKLLKLNINYAFLRINSHTDRMALVFGLMYDEGHADVKLLPSNVYHNQVKGKGSGDPWTEASRRQTNLQFEELQLGTTYSQLRHLVVRTVTASVSRTAGRMSMALSTPRETSTRGKGRKLATDLGSIREDEGSGERGLDVVLEKSPPRWDTPGWLDETLVVEGYCPDIMVHSADTLNDMMEADENIKLSFTQLTIHARSKPFAKGSVRAASYARTAASTDRFVVKSFLDDDKNLAHLVEDMRIQALCKAFALEFNGLLKAEHPIDFIVTSCLQKESETTSETDYLSLEPYIEGEYIKYNSNCMFVRESDDPFNQTAQAFSHFTFERSWGHFLVNDLQGVGRLLTDPSVQTRDHERFKLNDTNLFDEGFKLFFVTHECNDICRKLELKSNREMIASGNYEFRERWPTMEPTVCCSNKLCRRIVRLANTHESDKFPGYHWCDTCWPQLQSSITREVCAAIAPHHEFDVSKFFYESQGQLTPTRCPEHTVKDKSVSSAAVVGGSLYGRMKSVSNKKSISGRGW